jgi:hypothetical protein
MRRGAILAASLTMLAAACGDADAGVSARRADSASAIVDPPAPGSTGASDSPTEPGGQPSAAGTGPLDPTVFASTELAPVLDSLGFPDGWVLPDSFENDDVVQVAVEIITSGGEFDVDRTVSIRQPTGDPNAVLDDWLNRIGEAFELGPGTTSGTMSGGPEEERTMKGAGFPSDPDGYFEVTVITSSLDPDRIIVSVMNTTQQSTAPSLPFPAELLADLPDVGGCTATSTTIEYRTFASNIDGISDPYYEISYNSTCPDRTAFDGATLWAMGSNDGQVFIEGDFANVPETTGPSGFTFEMYATLETDGETTIYIKARHAL